MSNFSAQVKIPADGSINGGLTSPKNEFMKNLLGMPAPLNYITTDCSSIRGNERLTSLIGSENVGPFSVRGLHPARESLKRIFAEVKVKNPELYQEVRTAGMLCVRRQRGATVISNHSWGTAIDLYFGTAVVPRGTAKTHQGVLDLYPFFHNEGWYWGAEFGVPDAMHFEVSQERLRLWKSQNLI